MILRQAFAQGHNFYIAKLVDAFAPLISRGLKWRIRDSVTPPKEWRRLLILGDHHIGDVLYRTCRLDQLISGLPNCEIYYATTGVSAELLRQHPTLAGVIPCYRFDGRSALTAGSFEELRAMNFDAALVSSSIRYWADLVIAIRLGIPNRAAFVHKGFRGMVTLPLSIEYPNPYPQLFQQMVTQLTGCEDASTRLRPRIYLCDEDRRAAKKLLEDEGLGGVQALVAIFPTMRQSVQTWPMAHYAELCDTLHRKGVRSVLLGADSDKAALETLVARCRESTPPVMAAGRLPIRALCAFLSECDLALTTDSGGRHIANAAGIPVLFFRNLRSFETETGVYCETEQDLVPSRELLDAAGQDKLLQSISAQSVVEKIMPLLGRVPDRSCSALTP